jgi:hypothetical protein
MGMHEGLEWLPVRTEPDHVEPLVCDTDHHDDLDA